MIATIIGALAVAAITIFIIEVLIFAIEEAVEWFNGIDMVDETDLPFTLKDRIENGRFVMIQGVFNKETNEIKAAREVHAKNLGTRIGEAHRQEDLVVYS